MEKKETFYRLVSDYGYGDKTWTHRMITKKEVISILKKEYKWKMSIEEAMDDSKVHYAEIDHEDDKEDWDWQDS